MSWIWTVLVGIALLVALAVTGLKAWWRYSLRRTARSLYMTAYCMHGLPRNWQVADANQYPELDAEFYAQNTDALTSLRFRLLGDIADPLLHALTRLPRSFVRVLVAPDGWTLCGMYHLRAAAAAAGDVPRTPAIDDAGVNDTDAKDADRAGPAGGEFVVDDRQSSGGAGRSKQTRSVEFLTYFDSDSSLTTAPLNDAVLVEETPGSVRRFVSPGTAPEETLRKHLEHVATFMRSHTGIRPVGVPDLATLFDLMHRSSERAVAYRRTIGFVTGDEIDRMGGARLPPAFRAALKAEIERLHARFVQTGKAPG